MSYIPLNGSKVIEKANGELERRQTPATVLRDALAGVNEDAPDGTNGACRSYETSRAVDPSQGRGYSGKAQRPDPLLDALLKAVY